MSYRYSWQLTLHQSISEKLNVSAELNSLKGFQIAVAIISGMYKQSKYSNKPHMNVRNVSVKSHELSLNVVHGHAICQQGYIKYQDHTFDM